MSLHLLIISDNPSFAEYLCDILSSAGYRADFVPAETGAFHAIRSRNPDVILVAVEPAKVSALAREYHFHSPEGPRKIPLIVISESRRLEAELMQVYDFIPKPLDVKRLLDDLKALGSEKPRNHATRVLSDRQYHEISSHILSSTGLHFESRNRPALERGLAKRMSALLINCFDDYLVYLKRHSEDRHELQKLLQFLTVGETYFFRYPAQFQALRERLLTRYVHTGEPIRILSAGCSTGEEPYSIAIAIMEALPDWRSRDIKIYATDINNRSLKRAREGVYSPWSMRITNEHHQRRYFKRVGDSYLVIDEVKELVEFSHLNLSSLDGSPLASDLRGLDALFCRNVLIYFSPDAAARLVDSFAGMLKPFGQLFLGHAETLLHRCPQLEVRRQDNSFYYVKSAAPGSLSPVSPKTEPAGVLPPERLHRAAHAVLPHLETAPAEARTPEKLETAPGGARTPGKLETAPAGARTPEQRGTAPTGEPAPRWDTPLPLATALPAQACVPQSAPSQMAAENAVTVSPATVPKEPPQSAVTASPAAAAYEPPLSSSAQALQAARRLFEAEDFDAAEKLLDNITGSPEESEALVLRGFILAGKGLFGEATALCERILSQNDLMPEAYFLKGVLLDATDNPLEAAEEYRKALLLNHDFIMPRYHMGRVHLRLGRRRDAAREIRNSIRILSRLDEAETVPFSGGLTRAVCMMQLQNALAQVA